MNQLGILFKHRCWFSKSGVRPKHLHFYKLPKWCSCLLWVWGPQFEYKILGYMAALFLPFPLWLGAFDIESCEEVAKLHPLLSSHFKWQVIHSHIVDNHWLSAAGCCCGNPQSQRWKWIGALVCRPGTNCGLVPPMPPSPLPLSMTCASYSSYCLELQVSICLYGMSPLQQPATPPTRWFLLFALVNL